MKLDGTWETRLTQEMIDDEIVAAAAAKEAEQEPEQRAHQALSGNSVPGGQCLSSGADALQSVCFIVIALRGSYR